MYIGNTHFEYGQEYRTSFVERVSLALREGLDKCAEDIALQRDTATDFSDRPKSRGEVILELTAAFRDEPSSNKLIDLQLSVSHTSLQHRVSEIRMLFTRKRPYGNQEPQVAMFGELSRLESEAEGYFGQKA